MKRLIFIFILISSILMFTACAETSEYSDLLKGGWKFAYGDINDTPVEALNKEYKRLEDTKNLHKLYDDNEGFLWLMKEFKTPQKLIGKNVYILLGRMRNADETYFNGDLIGKTGRYPPNFYSEWNTYRKYPIPKSLLKNKGYNKLLIKLYMNQEGEISGVFDIGERDRIDRIFTPIHFVRSQLRMIFAFLLTLIALYHFFIFIKRTQDTENLYYALLCFFATIFTSNLFITLVFPNPPITTFLYERILNISLTLCVLLLTIFIQHFINRKEKKVIQIIIFSICFIGIIISIIPIDYGLFYKIRNINRLPLILLMPYNTVILISAIIKGNKDAKRIMISFSFFFIGALADTIFPPFLNVTDWVHLTPYGLVLFCFAMAGVLANRFINYRKEAEDLNIHLEQKVKERTRELEKANADLEKMFEEIHGLKIQQDGDYFLTSLLLNPLIANNATSKHVDIDFLVRQKKKFKFRKWDAELGGDINITHSITLNEKNYTVFLNGDAMGKSIQGAGGALVLGVVFNSYVTRTKYIETAQYIFPEQWLVDCYNELQSIFESFDGSMLVSVIMGMIDDETGLMYYFNAEHPFLVLYRDDHAKFVDEDISIRKIGSIGVNENLQIKTFELKPKDIIILGSDGRDDILLGVDKETGFRIINEDEKKFLEHVEKGEGKLELIEKEIRKFGEITDDFTMIRIAYKENFNLADTSNIPDEYNTLRKKAFDSLNSGDYIKAVKNFKKANEIYSSLDCYNGLIDSYLKLKDYSKALLSIEEALRYFPANFDLLLQASITSKKCRQFKKAIDYSERLKLLQPDNINNLVNLADSYRLNRNKDKAREIIELLENYEINKINKIQIKKLKELIDK